jgi:hypothetical protein
MNVEPIQSSVASTHRIAVGMCKQEVTRILDKLDIALRQLGQGLIGNAMAQRRPHPRRPLGNRVKIDHIKSSALPQKPMGRPKCFFSETPSPCPGQAHHRGQRITSIFFSPVFSEQNVHM